MMEELGTIQDLLTMHDFYIIDAKERRSGPGAGLLELGLESDVTELSAADSVPRSFSENYCWKTGYPAFG